MVGVTGSIPVPSTIFPRKFSVLKDFRIFGTVNICIVWRRRGGKQDLNTSVALRPQVRVLTLPDLRLATVVNIAAITMTAPVDAWT
jgi:hypothetical protein